MQRNDQIQAADAILAPGDADEPLETWEPEDFDHFTDLSLLRAVDAN